MDGSTRRDRLARSRLYLVVEARPHGQNPRPLLDAQRLTMPELDLTKDEAWPNL